MLHKYYIRILGGGVLGHAFLLTYGGRINFFGKPVYIILENIPTIFSYDTSLPCRFLVRIPECFPLSAAGPVLCSGVTMYSPLVHWKVALYLLLS